ncbi:MAG TPA: porphobilinogen synthase [Thermodesulfobacteriota bacterium]|nr:porphobilinogen synthase [Thermodesulfobacteriota bacterium]
MPLVRRPRRLRATAALRRMARETRLAVEQLVYPLFAVSGRGVRREIAALPGCFQLSPDRLVEEAAEVRALGIGQVLLFGVPDAKDETGSSAYDPGGVVQEAVRALKREVPDLVVVTDVCLCAYTTHGHCGVVRDGQVHNDASVEILARVAVSHAEAGADLVAPSDMMDGRVGALRRALDARGFTGVGILAYSAKFASAFYGPFREAQESAPRFGDRRSYQMDPANAREALVEVALDVEEGADIVMVKPALPYLDVIRRVRERVDVPVAAYNVSGEYAMVKAAAARGWLDGERAMLEVLTAIRRAGADLIITYFAKEAARLLRTAGG